MISSNLRLSQSFWWLFHLWQRRHFQASVIAAREATTNKWNINKITSTFGDQDEFDCFHLISGKQFGRGGAGVAEGGSIKYHWTSCLCQQGHLHPRPPLQPDKVADPWSSFQKNFHFTFFYIPLNYFKFKIYEEKNWQFCIENKKKKLFFIFSCDSAKRC